MSLLVYLCEKYHIYYFIITLIISFVRQSHGLLFPQENEKRTLREIGGLWWFVREPSNSIGFGFIHKWYNEDLSGFSNASRVPVPCAFNDLNAESAVRDHVGWVWYQRQFYVREETEQRKRRLFLRFASVNYYAAVFLNGLSLINHTGGHLPFEVELTDNVNLAEPNVLTVAVNNSLSHETVPQGEFQYKSFEHRNRSGEHWFERAEFSYSTAENGYFEQKPNFDFFNYAGILRPVYLYTIGVDFIGNIRLTALINGTLLYRVNVVTNRSNSRLNVRILNKQWKAVAEYRAVPGQGQLLVPHPQLWWPRGMASSPGYLYIFEVELVIGDKRQDIYRLPFGFRQVTYDSNTIFINGRPFYCQGFGMHEDFEIHGRGFNRAVMIKDLNLVEWMQGNCYRTSHYPYSEERQMEADRRGIAVLAETPAVGISIFTKKNQQLHMQMVTELINRDFNHPSVIMWSLSNEPKTTNSASAPYFRSIIEEAHKLDTTRPVTIVYGPSQYYNDKTAKFVDVICVNRYFGWYSGTGHLETIEHRLVDELTNWKSAFSTKPLLLTEYGAGSIPSLNSLPSIDFSETYQVQLMHRTHRALDRLRQAHIIAGEMIWNFADFMTAQDSRRVVGNRKGVLTRNRQPKMAAFVICERYSRLLLLVNNATSSININCLL